MAADPPLFRKGVADDDAESTLEAVDLKEVLATLRRHLWLVITIAAASVGVAAYVAYTSRPYYRSQAVIRLEDNRKAMTGGLDEPVKTTIPGSWTDPVQSQLQVLKSRSVAAGVVERQALGLRVEPIGIPGRLLDGVRVTGKPSADTLRLSFADSGFTVRGNGTEAKFAYGAPAEANGVAFRVLSRPPREQGQLIVRTQDAAIDELVVRLDAKQRKFTDVIDVEYSAHDRYVAQQVLNAVITAFQSLSAETAQQQSRRRRIFLQEQLQQTDSLLAQAQQRLSDFRSRAQVYGSDEKVSAEQTGLMSIETRREELAADRKVYQSLLDRLEDHQSQGRGNALRALVASPGIAENPVVQTQYAQLVGYEAALDSLTTGRWGSAPTNPDVQRLRTLVAASESKLADAVRSQVTSLDARIAALDELKARNAAALQRLPATQASEARLLEQVETTRKMAEQLREEFQKARVAEAVEAGQVEVVDHATLPVSTIGHGPKVKMLLGLIVGLFFGSGAALLLERLNTSIRRREEIESVLQLPGLAIIPQIAASSGQPGRLRIGNLNLPLPSAKRNGGDEGSNGSSLVTVSNLRSTSAEAFRTLRTNLIFSQAVQTLRRIVVTSPSPQDGKTTTAANLAVTFAQQGLRVLLIDCDLRRGRLHNVFRVPREPGFTQLLVGQNTAPQVIRSTLVERLSFIPSGALPPNPSELLGGAQSRRVLDALAGEFDVVILDTPPVHVAADSLILGTIADGVILVVRAGHTERHTAQDALQRLYNVGARVVGAVLNDPDHKVPQYGGYYHHEYYDAQTEEA
jgi:capsular exopolysaccharide synthesis family protein